MVRLRPAADEDHPLGRRADQPRHRFARALHALSRGPGGGYRLAHDQDQIRISDIIVAVDEPLHAVRCTPGEAIGCRGDRSRCLTHDLWEELSNQIRLYLSSVSLGDICEKRVLGTSGLAQRETYRAANAR